MNMKHIYEYARPFYNHQHVLIVGYCADCQRELSDEDWGKEHTCPLSQINKEPYFLSDRVPDIAGRDI